MLIFGLLFQGFMLDCQCILKKSGGKLGYEQKTRRRFEIIQQGISGAGYLHYYLFCSCYRGSYDIPCAEGLLRNTGCFVICFQSSHFQHNDIIMTSQWWCHGDVSPGLGSRRSVLRVSNSGAHDGGMSWRRAWAGPNRVKTESNRAESRPHKVYQSENLAPKVIFC